MLRPSLLWALLLILTVPAAAGQVNTGTPGEGCRTACTPEAANPGELPRTGDASVKMVLYGHFLDEINDAPLNGQPIDKCEPNLEMRRRPQPGIATQISREHDVRFDYNRFIMYSSAGLVEFSNTCEARDHQEAGLSVPLKVKGDTIYLYWYMSANPVPSQRSDQTPADTVSTTVFPQLAIYAHVETGRSEFTGEVLARGDTGAEDQGNVPNGPGRVTIINVPGQGEIYEFEVPLKVLKNEWPGFFSDGGGAGFMVVVVPYQIKVKEGPGAGSQVMQADWRVRTGPATPVHMVVETANPMESKAASLSLFNQAMFVRWSVVSPWGSYDTDPQSFQAHFVGATIDRRKVGLEEPLRVTGSLDHDGHFKPINATWKFDYRKAELPDGAYSLHLVARNFQGTYEIQQTLPFTMRGGQPIDVPIIGQLRDGGGEQTIAPPPPPEAPNLGVLAASVSLVGAAVLLRRRPW